MNDTLKALRGLAADVKTRPDTRPEVFRKMSYATQSLYYPFFYRLSMERQFGHVLELGTDTGTSAAHLGAFDKTIVMTVDHHPDAGRNAQRLGRPNVRVVTKDTLEYARELEAKTPQDRIVFGLCYFDTLHTFEHTYAEYCAFRRLLPHGALLFFDDIHESAAMEKFWAAVRDPKIELPDLHYTGFGAAVLDSEIRLG